MTAISAALEAYILREIDRLAYSFWQSKELARRRRDWRDAAGDMERWLGRQPTPMEKARRAEELHSERQSADALEDRLEAERDFMATRYRAGTIW